MLIVVRGEDDSVELKTWSVQTCPYTERWIGAAHPWFSMFQRIKGDQCESTGMLSTET